MTFPEPTKWTFLAVGFLAGLLAAWVEGAPIYAVVPIAVVVALVFGLSSWLGWRLGRRVGERWRPPEDKP